MRRALPRTSSSMAISIGLSKVADGISGRAGTGRGRSSNQHAFRPRSFKSRSAITEPLLPGGRNGVAMRHRAGRSTTGASGAKRPTNGIGASARIAGRGTEVKAVHRDSPSKDVARRVVEAQAPVGAGLLRSVLAEPHVLEFLVRVMIRRRDVVLHLRPVHHAPRPPDARDVVHVPEHDLLDLVDELLAFCGIQSPRLAREE